jgi:hypothetical protein
MQDMSYHAGEVPGSNARRMPAAQLSSGIAHA